MESDGLIDFSASIKPTRNRLLIAMGISAVFLALVLASLGSLFDFAGKSSKLTVEGEDRLTVQIRKGDNTRHPNPPADNETVRSLMDEKVTSVKITKIQQEVEPTDSREPLTESRPVKDWHAIASEAAKISVDDYFMQEESRASMWRRTHSVMFQPNSDRLIEDEEPLLSDIRFKRYSRVLGIGLNVGSCFIGIPIAGVPVEKRSVAITLFICG